MKRHCLTPPWRNTARLARLLSLLGKHAMFVQAIFAHFGRQNRLFERNATEREKTQDWLAVDAVESSLPNSGNYREYLGLRLQFQ